MPFLGISYKRYVNWFNVFLNYTENRRANVPRSQRNTIGPNYHKYGHVTLMPEIRMNEGELISTDYIYN